MNPVLGKNATGAQFFISVCIFYAPLPLCVFISFIYFTIRQSEVHFHTGSSCTWAGWWLGIGIGLEIGGGNCNCNCSGSAMSMSMSGVYFAVWQHAKESGAQSRKRENKESRRPCGCLKSKAYGQAA